MPDVQANRPIIIKLKKVTSQDRVNKVKLPLLEKPRYDKRPDNGQTQLSSTKDEFTSQIAFLMTTDSINIEHFYDFPFIFNFTNSKIIALINRSLFPLVVSSGLKIYSILCNLHHNHQIRYKQLIC
jgi:hypothetical protein